MALTYSHMSDQYGTRAPSVHVYIQATDHVPRSRICVKVQTRCCISEYSAVLPNSKYFVIRMRKKYIAGIFGVSNEPSLLNSQPSRM